MTVRKATVSKSNSTISFNFKRHLLKFSKDKDERNRRKSDDGKKRLNDI